MLIDGAEAGGGLLRAALPLSMARQIPIDVINFRSDRREPGLGWPHIVLLQALETSGLIEIEGVEMGSTELSVAPRKPAASGISVMVDLDDPKHTFTSTEIHAARDYDRVEDAFPGQSLNNWNGKGVRGHAVSTPLLGLLPLTLSGVDLTLYGGTETPGAPFVDALSASTVTTVNSLFDLSMRVGVLSRGAFGIGGGAVSAYCSLPGPQTVREDDPLLITYWSEAMAHSGSPRALLAQQNIDQVRSLLPGVRTHTEYYEDDCHAVNQLIILPETSDRFARDISLCSEEDPAHISGDALTKRVSRELAHRDIVSRFHIEQVLLFASILNRSGSWRTERVTPHIQAVAKLLQETTYAEITMKETLEYTEIRIG